MINTNNENNKSIHFYCENYFNIYKHKYIYMHTQHMHTYIHTYDINVNKMF